MDVIGILAIFNASQTSLEVGVSNNGELLPICCMRLWWELDKLLHDQENHRALSTHTGARGRNVCRIIE